MSPTKLAFVFCVLVLMGNTSVYALEATTQPSAEIQGIASGASDSKVTKVTVSNPSGTGNEVYGLDIYVPSGIKISKAIAPDGWTIRIKSDMVSFDTKSSPIIGDNGEVFSITTDAVLTSLYYEAYDADNNFLASQYMPVSLVSYTQPPYTNDLYGFAIKYPQGWFLQDSPKFGDFTAIVGFFGPSTPEFASNINIKTDDLQGASFSDYIDSAKSGLATGLGGSDYILKDEGPTTIGSNSAYFLEYTANVGTQVDFKSVIIEYGNTIYIVTLASSDNQYDQVVKSFDSSVSTLHISKDIHKDISGTRTGSRV